MARRWLVRGVTIWSSVLPLAVVAFDAARGWPTVGHEITRTAGAAVRPTSVSVWLRGSPR